jgi:hypothetical protein
MVANIMTFILIVAEDIDRGRIGRMELKQPDDGSVGMT